MATTFYLPKDNSTGGTLNPGITPANSAWWNSSNSGFYKARSYRSRANGAAGSTTLSQSITLANDVLYASFYSELFSSSAAITGTISFAIQQHSTTFTNTILCELIVRTINGADGTIRGTNLAHTNGTFFAGTTFNSNYISAATLTSVTPSVGDFLWFEVGIQDQNSSDSGFLMFRDDNATTDLPIGSQSATTTNNPSIIFNTTIAASFNTGVWPEIGGQCMMLMGVGN
jgi:hypothetical protein